MNVLVAGGAGYIGSTLVPLLLSRGVRVTVLDRFYFGDTLAQAKATYGDKLTLVRGDTRSFDKSILNGIEGVCDLAGISNDPSCELEPQLTLSVNIDGGKRLATLAKEAGVRRYVYSSSCSVYGHGQGLGLTETSSRNPVSAYARSKVELEDVLMSTDAPAGFEPVLLRLATVFGVSSRMRFDLAINVMTKNAYVNRSITVDGGGRQWRPFVHVQDVAEAFHTALTQPKERVTRQVFNVGSKEGNVQILNLAFRVRDAIPGTSVVHAPTDPDLRDYNVSFDKIEGALDYRAKKTIDHGIAEVLESLRGGSVDPDDRRWYTLKQYVFGRAAARAFRDMSEGGFLLEAPR
jgi:nucleoside-diphosphate-sugar epimerase